MKNSIEQGSTTWLLLCVCDEKIAYPPIHIEVSLLHDSTQGLCMSMSEDTFTFNDFPQVVAELRDGVPSIKALSLHLQNRPTRQGEQDTVLSRQSRLPNIPTFPLQLSIRNSLIGKSSAIGLAWQAMGHLSWRD